MDILTIYEKLQKYFIFVVIVHILSIFTCLIFTLKLFEANKKYTDGQFSTSTVTQVVNTIASKQLQQEIASSSLSQLTPVCKSYGFINPNDITEDMVLKAAEQIKNSKLENSTTTKNL